MSENQRVFRERVVTTETPEEKHVPVEPQKGDPESPDTYSINDRQEESLEIWEGESRKKYVNEYFNTHNIAHEFVWKMPISEIDKYIRSEIESKEYEKTTSNYKRILSDIENKIGSNNLELSKRLNKIVGYIRALNKLYKAKELKDRFEFSNPQLSS